MGDVTLSYEDFMELMRIKIKVETALDLAKRYSDVIKAEHIISILQEEEENA